MVGVPVLWLLRLALNVKTLQCLKVRRHPIGSSLLLAILPFASAGTKCWNPQVLPRVW